MKRILLILVLLSSCCFAQTTINAATCSAADVATALGLVAADNTTVVIPAGNCTWTTNVTYNQVYSTTIQGQTTCSGTPVVVAGGVAALGTDITCTDVTTITDNINRGGSDVADLAIGTATGKSLRVTGITWAQINGFTTALTNLGVLRISGSSQSVRLDHMHFNSVNQTMVSTDGVFGVFDHILGYVLSEFWRPMLVSLGGVGVAGDKSWATATQFGTNQFMYMEDSTITGPAVSTGNGLNDCLSGGKFVVRYTHLDFSSVQGHGTGHAGDDRGCRAHEFYRNVITISSGTDWQFNADFISGGSALIWGNIAPPSPPYYSHFVTAHINREDNSTYPQFPVPTGWGYCGTSVNGTGSAWDFSAITTDGYPCIDNVGRGAGDLLSGSFPTKVNTARGNVVAYPQQALEPIYEWSDSWACTGDVNCIFWVDYDAGSVANRDYFLGFGNTSCNPGAGACTAGTGVGLLSQRPASCTTNATSDAAGNHPGVGWWATDTSTLYVCTATNTWTSYYQPYTYPNPLTGVTAPTCTLAAAPAVIKLGTSSTLTFTPANTPTTCSIDNGVGAVSCSGATPSVSPTTLTTYTATVTNAGGTNTCSASVTIGGTQQGANTIRTANTVTQ